MRGSLLKYWPFMAMLFQQYIILHAPLLKAHVDGSIRKICQAGTNMISSHTIDRI